MKFFGVFLVICIFRACSSETSTARTAEAADVDKTVKSPSHIVIRLASKKFLICEGVLIANNVVLTAAGCVHKYSSIPNNLEVVAGLTSTENIESQKKYQTRRVSAVNIHPEFISSKKRDGDIAVLNVTRPFKMTDNVGIASYGDESAAQRNVRLVGYGNDDKKNDIPLKALSIEDCRTYAGAESKDSVFCAKLRDDKDNVDEGFYYTDPSYAGAPLFYSDTDKPIACGLAPSNSGLKFVNITHFAPWVQSMSNVGPTKTTVLTTSTSSPSTDSTTEK